MNPENFRTLVVNHIGNVPEEDMRVAISPPAVKYITSRDIKVNGRDLKDVMIIFNDSDHLPLTISAFELSVMEEICTGGTFD